MYLLFLYDEIDFFSLPYATLYDKVCQWLATGQWFSLGIPVSSTNKTDRHDYSWNIVEISIKHHIGKHSKF
jgi:hypothetical protein